MAELSLQPKAAYSMYYQLLKVFPRLPRSGTHLQLMPSNAAMSAGSRKAGMDRYSWQRCSAITTQQEVLCVR